MLILSAGYAQISPGDLSEAHKEFEGMRNCTQCHELGDKVTNNKCLDCHTEMRSLLKSARGYHSSFQVKSKNCSECHSDHHGRNFNMIRFDEKNFDHSLAGYELEGQHAIIDCRQCHKPDNVQDKKLKDRKNTFLGLDQKCLSCHEDYHQETLSSNECVSCHNMESFSPAPKFDHSETSFKLLGQHVQIECKECHATGIRNGRTFQDFRLKEFNDCKACHDDPHKNPITTNCKQCHTEESFSVLAAVGKFDHKATGFELRGRHGKTDCFDCHAKTSNPLAVFRDRGRTDENNCILCHQDPHESKFGQDCVKCHTEQSFLSLKTMDFFNHDVTDYPLKGKHLETDCRKCHSQRFSEPLKHESCTECHEDYHRGEFKSIDYSPDCVDCHSLERGFEYSLYTIDIHQVTDFPLEGAHIATPCSECHVDESENRWSFKNVGIECADCHRDIHEGIIEEKYYPEKSCTSCHMNDSWSTVAFDHLKTGWPLEGEHRKVDCRECHFQESDKTSDIVQQFKGLEHSCTTCHENVHGDLFALEGVTDCRRCHSPKNWYPENFDHGTTRFPLEGKHLEIDCVECHVSDSGAGNAEPNYKIGKLECTDCHQ